MMETFKPARIVRNSYSLNDFCSKPKSLLSENELVQHSKVFIFYKLDFSFFNNARSTIFFKIYVFACFIFGQC